MRVTIWMYRLNSHVKSEMGLHYKVLCTYMGEGESAFFNLDF